MAAKRKPHVPTLWKVKAAGKEIGNWRTTIKGERINLGTKDPDEARRRRALALKGERRFETSDTDAGAAATAIVAALDGTGGAKTPPVVEPPRPAVEERPAPPHTAAAALPTSTVSTAPTVALQPDPVRPDGYVPPASGWAEAVRGAAAEAEGAAASSQAAGEGGDAQGERVDADMLRELIEFAAVSAVELQLFLQSWAIKKGLKIKTAVVTDDAKGREVGKKLWARCFERLVPTDLPIPDYIAAPVLIAALTLPLQLGEGATVIKDDDKETQPGASAPSAAAAA